VVLKEDVRGVSGSELLKFCKERLAAYKVPQYVEFRDMLPSPKSASSFEEKSGRGAKEAGEGEKAHPGVGGGFR